jgi:hypothetical protein
MDNLTLDRAVVRILKRQRTVPEWLRRELVRRAETRLRSKEPKRVAQSYKELARWFAVVWFMEHKGMNVKEARRRAALAYGKRGGGDSTFKHAYESFRRKHPDHPTRQRGGELMTPADIDPDLTDDMPFLS